MKYVILFNDPNYPDAPRRITREASSLRAVKKFIPSGCELVAISSICEDGSCPRPTEEEE